MTKSENKKSDLRPPQGAALRRAQRFSVQNRAYAVRESVHQRAGARAPVTADFDYGPISRAEMRDIVLEMIG